MANIQIKPEQITPFGGIISIINFKKPVKDILAKYKTEMVYKKHLSGFFDFLKKMIR